MPNLWYIIIGVSMRHIVKGISTSTQIAIAIFI